MSKTTPQLIKLADITSKDPPGSILKKIKKYDRQFYDDCEIEIKACLDKHYLPFDEFSSWLNESYLRYIIRSVYIYSVSPNSKCAELIETIYTQSIQQLRKCSPKVKDPLGVLYNVMSEIWTAAYLLLQDYRPDLKVIGKKALTELDFSKPITSSTILKNDTVLKELTQELEKYNYLFDDKVVFTSFPVFYTVWLQAVVAWSDAEQFITPLFMECIGNTEKADTNFKRKKKNQKQ